MFQPRPIRIFLSSPGDVADERVLALQVIEQLQHRPAFRDRVTLHPIAWDKIGAGTPLLATMTPQEAINEGLPKPSECDIVVVLFWARIGTLLPAEYLKTDGSRYWSGTEWEYWDAFNTAKATDRPLLVVYRRTEKVLLDDEAPDYEQRLEQKRRVKTFFDTFTNPDGSIRGGYNTYEKPEDFRSQFESHLESLILRLLEARSVVGKQETAKPIEPWSGSPFPGLRAFTPADAPIFFGRGRETDALVQRVKENRFVAVMGASGSGKSSLVGAGLIPRLKGNSIEGSKDWLLPDYEQGRGWIGLRFTPGELGDNPFVALAARIGPVSDTPREMVGRFGQDTTEWIAAIRRLLTDKPAWAEVLLFIDQFEELFTVVAAQHRQPFLKLLVKAAETNRLRMVVTMRADFYHRAVEYHDLAELLRDGSFPLPVPGLHVLLEIISRPAERAGLVFEENLPERILVDTGENPGSLPLMAYTLDELYHKRTDCQLTAEMYERLGGVRGAIGKRAEQAYQTLDGSDKDKNEWLQRVFFELVAVDEYGTATRRRMPLERISDEDMPFTNAFVDARLLVKGENTLEVAHEALFRSWQRLADWIIEAQEDLILLRQVRAAAEDWTNQGKPDFLRWPAERLKLVKAMIERSQPKLTDTERDYVEPEQMRLLRELTDLPPTPEQHRRRLDIGNRLGVIGDPREGIGICENGNPEIVWCYVDVPVELRGRKIPFKTTNGKVYGEFEVQPFYIAKYLVTYMQYEAFATAEDGFSNMMWWDGFPKDYQPHELRDQRTQSSNNPRDCISWYQSVAFTRWLNRRLTGTFLSQSEFPVMIGKDAEIRLPMEWEWQWVAQGGIENREYPWGEWQAGFSVTAEAGLGRAIAVGMYPHGAAICGAMDMAGNLWEWCLNNYDNPQLVFHHTGN